MVNWTPKSESDLDEIREHIAKNFSVDLAIGTVDKLVDFTESTLSSNPLAGKILESNILFSKLTYEGNSIYYCNNPRDGDIYIVYVQPRGTNYKKDRVAGDEVA